MSYQSRYASRYQSSEGQPDDDTVFPPLLFTMREGKDGTRFITYEYPGSVELCLTSEQETERVHGDLHRHVQPREGSRGAAPAQSASQVLWNNTVATTSQAGTSVLAPVSATSLPLSKKSRGSGIRCRPCTKDDRQNCRNLQSHGENRSTVSRDGTDFEVCANCFYKATEPETYRNPSRYPKFDPNFHPSSCDKKKVDKERGVANDQSKLLARTRKRREERLEAEREQSPTLSADSSRVTDQYFLDQFEYQR